ncbi:hypothetical protein B0H21DRAFT_32686 [Amylocystis lapponica]|nr:hypothetical protein B0H21DRAFT_32686 [Amylocystis lapponica]
MSLLSTSETQGTIAQNTPETVAVPPSTTHIQASCSTRAATDEEEDRVILQTARWEVSSDTNSCSTDEEDLAVLQRARGEPLPTNSPPRGTYTAAGEEEDPAVLQTAHGEPSSDADPHQFYLAPIPPHPGPHTVYSPNAFAPPYDYYPRHFPVPHHPIPPSGSMFPPVYYLALPNPHDGRGHTTAPPLSVPTVGVRLLDGVFKGLDIHDSDLASQESGWHNHLTIEDRLLVMLRWMRNVGFATLGEFFASLFADCYTTHPTVYHSVARFMRSGSAPGTRPMDIIELMYSHSKACGSRSSKSKPFQSLPRHVCPPSRARAHPATRGSLQVPPYGARMKGESKRQDIH